MLVATITTTWKPCFQLDESTRAHALCGETLQQRAQYIGELEQSLEERLSLLQHSNNSFSELEEGQADMQQQVRASRRVAAGACRSSETVKIAACSLECKKAAILFWFVSHLPLHLLLLFAILVT